MTAHIAAGWPWFGRDVTRCGVLYIGAEGQAGLKKRIKAWKVQHSNGQENFPFALYPAPIDIVTDPKGAEAVVDRIEFLRRLWDIETWIVVIDTLARCFGSGDESATKDMNTFVTRCDTIRNKARAAVLVVHHFGRDESKGMRGSIALRAAADTVIEVTGIQGVRTARVEKQKDGAAGEKFYFTLRPVDVGKDEAEQPLTSCVIEPVAGAATAKGSTTKLSAPCAIALRALRQAIDEGDVVPPACNHIPANVRAVPPELWRRYAYQQAISDTDNTDAKRKAFKRSSDQLLAHGVVACRSDFVWIP